MGKHKKFDVSIQPNYIDPQFKIVHGTATADVVISKKHNVDLSASTSGYVGPKKTLSQLPDTKNIGKLSFKHDTTTFAITKHF